MQIKRDDYQVIDNIENLTVREIAVEHNIGHRKRLLITYKCQFFLLFPFCLKWGPSEGENGVLSQLWFFVQVFYFLFCASSVASTGLSIILTVQMKKCLSKLEWSV